MSSPASPSSSLNHTRVVPLTELAETSQIILSKKPRLINVTHQIPYTCTLIDKPSVSSSSSSSSAAPPVASSSTSTGPGSPPINRRSSYIAPRSHVSASAATTAVDDTPSASTDATDGDCILEHRRGHSALYSGVMSLSKDLETIQIGWVGELADQDGYVIPCKSLSESQRGSLKEKLWQKEKVVPIFLEDSLLWPLFHYILWDEATDGRIESKNWDDYVIVNQQFADAVLEQYRPGDIGAFPTYSYARHFISCCTRVNGYESTPRGVDAMGSTVWVGTFPIGIDAERVERQRKSPAVLPKMDAIRKTYKGKRIIVGRDKLDLVKGVQQKLQAFEKFLNDYPEMQGEVVLIQVTSPPLVENQKLEAKIAELVAHINGTYGSLNFTPVHHYHQHIDRDEYYALLSVADIGLITSVRDGMNTTSLEYIMCQSENHGPLILSEFTGTAGSLSGAMMVNPWDYQGVARVIYDALNLNEEDKLNRHNQLHKHVLSHTAQFWAKNFIAELTLNVGTWDQSTPTPYLDFGTISDRYHKAKKRLLMFDYDGTLTPIRKTPGAAVPQEHMLKALAALAADPKNIVWVISGRDQKVLEDWLGHIANLGFSAEHGSFTRQPGSKKWVNLTESLDMSWKNDVIEIFTYYTERTQGSFIEHKRSSLAWHYRLADPEWGAFQAKECQNHLEGAVLSKLPVEILVGKKNLEVRPTIVNKGEIVKRLLGQHPDVEFVMCAGDDKTDEDMFRALGGPNNSNSNNNTLVNGDLSYSDDLIAETAVKISGSISEQAEEHCTAAVPHGHGHGHGQTMVNGLTPAVQDGPFLKPCTMVSCNGVVSSPPTTTTTTMKNGSSSNNREHFSITIGHALKKTLANWHVTSPEELIRVLGILSGTIDP
ncbi:threalose-6-phosphate phosphatase [Mortierella sp. GBA30]|nr:threalose-6-phosphate phosphatase [Mortierella sp. GBA30]